MNSAWSIFAVSELHRTFLCNVALIIEISPMIRESFSLAEKKKIWFKTLIIVI